MVVAGLQHQHLEHQDVVKRRPPTFRTVRARHRPFKVAAEQLKINHPTQPLQCVALGRKFLQPLLNIKKSRLTPHPRPPAQIQTIESSNHQKRQVFGAPQLIVAAT